MFTVLIVFDHFDWILGRWAQEISKNCPKGFNILYISDIQARANLPNFRLLCRASDVVHFLPQHHLADLFSISEEEHTAILASIHHVVEKDVDFNLPAHYGGVMVVASEWHSYCTQNGVPPEKLHLVFNGVSTKEFTPATPLNKRKARELFGISGEAFVIGFFAKYSSNFNDRKGTRALVDALTRFADDPAMARVKALITGPGWGDLIQSNPHISRMIHYYPFLNGNDLHKAFHALDAYLCTSKVEGGPAPVLEAWSSGVAVVSTDVGIVRDYGRHEKNVLKIATNSTESAIFAVKDLMVREELREKLAIAGLATARNELEWSIVIRPIFDAYRSVAASSPRRRQLSPSFLRTRLGASGQRFLERARSRNDWFLEVQRSSIHRGSGLPRVVHSVLKRLPGGGVLRGALLRR